MRTRAYKGIAMEGIVAKWYARSTGGDLRRFQRTAEKVRQRAPGGDRILEVAPGPGYLAIELARSEHYAVTGLDISESFVRMARHSARTAGVRVDFQQGNAADMPFEDESFDFIVCIAAFKNFGDPVGALNEFHRVLKPNGSALIQDLRKEASRNEVDAEVRDMRMSALNAAITRWVFRHVLLKSAVAGAELRRLVADSRFRSGRIVRDGIGFELWLTRGDDAGASATRT